MPYAPGIQDISGQLLGEGMTRASNVRAQARSDFGRTIADTLIGGIKQYQQNENFTTQSLAKFTERMQDPEFNKYVNNILADDSNKMGVPESVKTAFRNAQTGKLKPNEASTLATIAQDYSERQMASAKAKQINLQNQSLQNEINQQQKLADYILKFPPDGSAKTNAQATNAAQFMPGAAGQQFLPNAAPFGMAAPGAAGVSAPAAQQASPSRFRKAPDASAAPAQGMPVTSSIQPSEAALPPSVASGSPMVTAARPIDQYRALRPSDVSFAPAALAAAKFAGETAPARSAQAAPSSAPAPVISRAAAASAFSDPAVTEATRQKFDQAISAPAGAFTLPKSTLSPEAKAIAKRLRDEFDDLSAISEKRAGSSRLTAAEDDSKGETLKKKRTITLDEEGIKAILSNPRILVESFGDVMGDTYQRAVRNQATDAQFANNVRLRELERQFGLGSRTNVRRGK